MKAVFCRRLRAKKLYVPAQAQELAQLKPEDLHAVGHCWCNQTLSEVGPDDLPVHPTRCTPQRACYQE